MTHDCNDAQTVTMRRTGWHARRDDVQSVMARLACDGTGNVSDAAAFKARARAAGR